MNTKRKKLGRKLLSFLLTLAMVVGLVPGMSLTALATDNPSYTLDGTIAGGGNAYANDSDITQNNVSWKVKGNTMENPWRIGGKSLSGENRDVYSTGTINSDITEVMLELGYSTITVNSVTLTVASDSSFSTVLAQQTKNGVAADSTLSFKPTSGTWSNAYYKFTFNVTNSNPSNKYVQFKAAKFYAAAATVPVTGVTLNPSAAQSINVGGSVAFTATVAPDGATDKTVKWSTTGGVTLYSDENCTAGNEIGADATSTLTVYAKGISAGSATVTVTSNDDSTKSASCDVTVNEAAGEKAYAAYDVTTDTNKTKSGNDLTALQVTFNERKWYIIEDNSSSATEGTVTLLAADNAFGLSAFSDSYSDAYSSSKIKTALDAYTTTGAFKDVASAIADTNLDDVSVTGAKLYLLSTEEANSLPENVRKIGGFEGGYCYNNEWWLRTPGSPTNPKAVGKAAVYVAGGNGSVYDRGGDVAVAWGVRPALKLNLESVIFSSETNTFTVGSAASEPENIIISPASGDIAEALAAAEEGKTVGDITINLTESVTYTISNTIVAPASLTINGNGAIIDAGNLNAPMIALANIENPTQWTELNIAVSGLYVNGLKKQMFYSACKNYLCKTFTVDNCVVEVAADVITFDFTKGSVAESFVISNSTFYAPTATTKSLYSSQGGQKLTEYNGDTQSFKLTHNTFFNLAPTKNFFVHRQNNQKWLSYEAKGNVFANCGKSGQVIIGLNGGSSGANPTWDIDGNLFNYDGADTSATETTGDNNEPVKNSVAGVVTFVAPASGNFNGTLELSGGATLPEKLGDPRFTLSSHTHSFTYSASGATITATCSADGCNLTDSKATLTIVKPTLETYLQTGAGISTTASLDGLDAFNTATGLTVAASDIKYYGVEEYEIEGHTYKNQGDELAQVPTAAGEYVAGLTLSNVKTSETETGDVIARVWYTIAPASISSVTVTDITAPVATEALDTAATTSTANVTLGTVTWNPTTTPAAYATQYTATVIATADTNYAFADAVTATVNGETAIVTKNDDGTLSIAYTFEKTALTPVTITATDKEVTYSADGIAIPVEGMFTITEGAGEAAYAVENGTGEGTYDAQTGKLTVTKCGTFTVKASTAATDTYAAGAETSATLTVNKIAPTVTAPTARTLTYTGSAQELVNAGEATGGTMYYAVTTENKAPTDENLYTTSIPTATNARTYYVWYRVIGDASHNDSAASCVTVSIGKKNASVTANAAGKTYGDADPTLTATVTGMVGTDTLNYTLGRATGNAVDTYAITVTLGVNPNYEVTTTDGVFTISKREIVVSGINANDKDYDGNTDATLDYTYVTYGNMVASDAGKLSVSAVGTFEDAQIGKAKTVNVTGLTLSGEAAGNYVLATEGQQTTATADICELENVTTDTNFVAKVKDFEGQVPTVTGLDLALAKSLCTPAELAAYTAGEKLELDLEISKAGALMTDDVITLVTNALKDQKNAKLDGAYYMDVTLYLKVGNAAPRKITNLGGKSISIQMDVPEDMYNHVWENRRTYYIVGVHAGVAKVHASTTDHKVPFDTDEFSVFALCYADVNVITYPSGTSTSNTATTATTTVSPKTYGESASERLLVLFGSASAVAALVTGVYTFRRRKEEE